MARNKVLAWVTIAGMVAVLAIASALFLPQVTYAQTDDDTTTQDRPVRQGYRMGLENSEEALADALGITVEELASAHTEAAAAALDQAVASDLLTQTQADAMQQRLAAGAGGMGRGGMQGFGAMGWLAQDAEIDFDALLADALGISVEELDAARSEAHTATVAAAVEAGDLTQEEADLMTAHMQLRPYIADAHQSVLTAAVDAALADGVIDDAQAELLKEQGLPLRQGMRGGRGNAGFGPFASGERGFGGPGHAGRGQGMPWGMGQGGGFGAGPNNP